MSPAKYKISILGTGNMGRALGLRFAALGHSVFFGGRNPSEAPSRAAQQAGPNAQAGSLDNAAAYGEIIVWTARERDPQKVLTSLDVVKKLEEKTIIDLCNRDYVDEVVGHENDNPKWFDTSLGETLQAALPRAMVVKAFNTVAMEALDTSAETLRLSEAQIFIAGNDPDARQRVEGLAEDIGFRCVDLGGGKTAMRAAEALGDIIRFVMIDRQVGGRANVGIRMLNEPDLQLVGRRESSKYT